MTEHTENDRKCKQIKKCMTSNPEIQSSSTALIVCLYVSPDLYSNKLINESKGVCVRAVMTFPQGISEM